MNRLKLLSVFTVLVAILLITNTGHSATVNGDIEQVGNHVTFAGNGPAGGGTWNAIEGTTINAGGTSAALLASDNTPTSFTVSTDFPNAAFLSNPTVGNDLIDDYLFSDFSGNSYDIRFEGMVPNGQYDLYLFGTERIGPNTGTEFTIAGEGTQSTTGHQAGDPFFTLGHHYVVFNGVPASGTGDITITAGQFARFNGFQIVGPIPEPSTATLIGLGVIALGAAMRRRKKS